MYKAAYDLKQWVYLDNPRKLTHDEQVFYAEICGDFHKKYENSDQFGWKQRFSVHNNVPFGLKQRNTNN